MKWSTDGYVIQFTNFLKPGNKTVLLSTCSTTEKAKKQNKNEIEEKNNIDMKPEVLFQQIYN